MLLTTVERMVFSTYVEVILLQVQMETKLVGILHVCGGDPNIGLSGDGNVMYSPRMWRWSLFKFVQFIEIMVFSTYVEVILCANATGLLYQGILHVCGGDPIWVDSIGLVAGYSPRMWRWSWHKQLPQFKLHVFSTYVEVIPPTPIKHTIHEGILHVCGGDPLLEIKIINFARYSPRMWRWSFLHEF